MQGRAERRMTRKRQLFRDRENADLFPFPSFRGGVARQDERCLGKIHLPGETLHFVSVQSASVGKNGERITGQRRLGEDVNLDEFVSAVRHELRNLIADAIR